MSRVAYPLGKSPARWEQLLLAVLPVDPQGIPPYLKMNMISVRTPTLKGVPRAQPHGPCREARRRGCRRRARRFYYGRKASGESPQGPPPIPFDTDSCFAACTVIICMNAEASESPLVPAPDPPKTVVGTLRLANASAQTFWVST